jgi:chromosome segregation ATPase
MAGEHRIIAFGANSSEDSSDLASNGKSEHRMDETLALARPPQDGGEDISEDAWRSAWVATDEPATVLPSREWLAPVLAGSVALAWTAFFVYAHVAADAAPIGLEALPAMVAQWAMPLALIGVVWLLALRNSSREARRFGNIARTLASESAQLEARLVTVNRELSLAREFVAAQSRDLETLGRLAAERLSSNAERLQDLIRDNGSRVESISGVSQAALDNMEKLRSQLPVIASSAKDVTNNIGNAGRAAHVQLEDMINGFNRLNEYGSASERQVGQLRQSVEGALAEIHDRSEQIGALAETRFAALAERGTAFRAELDGHETAALASLRSRAGILEAEISNTRAQLDLHEEESLTSLRARLVALREESDVVSRALRDGEGRAAEAWRQALDEIHGEQAEIARGIAQTQEATVSALRGSLSVIGSDAEALDRAISERREKLAAETGERQARQAEQERHALARIDQMLGDLDHAVAERLERHRLQAAALNDRAAAVTAELGDYEARFAAIANSSETLETRLRDSLASLSERLTAARATMAATDGDAEKLTETSVRLLELIQGSARYAHHELPEALAVSEGRLERLQSGITTVLDALAQSARSGEELAGGVETSGNNLKEFADELSAMHSDLSEHGAAHAKLLQVLHTSLTDIDAATEAAAGRARNELREAIAALGVTIDESVAAIETDSAARIARVAESLGTESAQAIDRSMRTRVAEVTGQLDQAVAHASGATREATIQLREQLSKVDDLVGNLEKRVSQAREKAEEQVDNDFARRAALITEALNSNAIDITSALSSEVSDTAWASYLRGDRGIFTRRAVSLLDAGEIKSIQQLFERDDAFREHVSRYIHDFESILRQVLSTRDGNALGVTLLSSDMGKLYVALAQGIERLRS